MKHKVSELEGARLDIAVMRAEHCHKPGWVPRGLPKRYSTDWKCGGPIIERERIDIASPDEWTDDLRWFAGVYQSKTLSGARLMFEQRGATPLIAAMRAFVASKLGEEVEL